MIHATEEYDWGEGGGKVVNGKGAVRKEMRWHCVAAYHARNHAGRTLALGSISDNAEEVALTG